MQHLNITIVQSELAWHDAARNRAHFTTIVESIDDSDLIILPEMFTTGFSMDAAALAEPVDGDTVAWLRKLASQLNSSICGSLIVKDGDHYFNRFICVDEQGETVQYDKRHLFRLAGEQHYYQPGAEIVTFDINGFRICPMICYDLRFPVWSRNTVDYDLLLYVANWPSARQFAWDTLLRARAIENLCFVAGVNRVGNDGNDLPYTGGSCIVDYLGADLANLGAKPGIAHAQLDKSALNDFRERFAFHKDADVFELR